MTHPKVELDLWPFLKSLDTIHRLVLWTKQEKKHQKLLPKDRTLRTHQDYSCDVCEINDLPRLPFFHTWEAIGMPLLQLAVPGTLTT